MEAGRVAARVLGAGATSCRLARAGADAALTYASKGASPRTALIAARPAGLPARPASPTEIAQLVYELLDAHDDTAQMASDLTSDPMWREHLEYLQALQRKGRETLAHAVIGSAR